jgi:hypothetical protein
MKLLKEKYIQISNHNLLYIYIYISEWIIVFIHPCLLNILIHLQQTNKIKKHDSLPTIFNPK